MPSLFVLSPSVVFAFPCTNLATLMTELGCVARPELAIELGVDLDRGSRCVEHARREPEQRCVRHDERLGITKCGGRLADDRL